METTQPVSPLQPAKTSTRRDRILTIVVAVVAAVIVWAIARLILGEDLTTTVAGADSATTIGIGAVIGASLIGGLIAWGVLTLLERLTARPGRIWPILGAIVLAVSLLGPLTQANGTGTTIALIVMHLVVGGILIAGLLRTISAR